MEEEVANVPGASTMKKFGAASSGDAIKSSVQKAGFLLKLPFRKQQGKWQKRWFVCKDGFMLYYGSKKLKGVCLVRRRTAV